MDKDLFKYIEQKRTKTIKYEFKPYRNRVDLYTKDTIIFICGIPFIIRKELISDFWKVLEIKTEVIRKEYHHKIGNFMKENGISILSVGQYLLKERAYENIYSKDIEVNPSWLHLTELTKNVSATEIYNELMMWIPTLKRNDIIESLSNDSLIQKHGFDLKQSFRHRK